MAVTMVNTSVPWAFFVARFLFTVVLVFATYNPTGYSLYHWITDIGAGPPSLKVTVALTLVMIYFVIFRVVFAALRRSGLIVGGFAASLFAIELASVVAAWQSQRSWHFYVLLSQYVTLCGVAILLSF